MTHVRTISSKTIFPIKLCFRAGNDTPNNSITWPYLPISLPTRLKFLFYNGLSVSLPVCLWVFSVVVTTAAQSSASWTGCFHTRGRGDSLDLEPRDWREMGYQPLSTACLLRSGARVCLPFGYLLTHTSHTDSSLFYFRLLVHQLVCFFFVFTHAD